MNKQERCLDKNKLTVTFT